MHFFRFTILTILIGSFGLASGQTATISGQVSDEDGRLLSGVSVTILGQQSGISTTDSGRFSLQVRAGKAVGLVFSYTGYLPQQRNFYLIKGETEFVRIMLQSGQGTLQDVTITSQKERREAGLVRINPKLAFQNPAPIGGIENLIKIFVNSRSELSSQYEVRGGNYDENLVYVNDFEVFRPYLVRSGQQEGLSFINPELARNVNFYNGGFQARYGDKMSSVLDVTYKRPKTNAGSAYIGLLEQGFHLEGASKNQKITWLTGVRNRSLRNLLGSQETKGNYLPHSADLQGLITYQPNSKWLLELLANLSQTSFTLEPQESQQTTSVFTPLFSSNLGLDIYFNGREEDRYRTRMTGLSATRIINPGFQVKGMLSYFNNHESENINIAGSYLFGDRSFDRSSADFGQITNPLGAGVFLNYARNQLEVQVINGSLKANIDKPNSDWMFGTTLERHFINDKLLEWNYQDSAGYSLPNQAGPLQISSNTRGTANLEVTRLSGYAQNNRSFPKIPGLIMQAGIRYNYNTLNKEWLISPRAGLSYHPVKRKKNIILKLNSGMYHQPVFYREMRDYTGKLNTQMKAQRSIQVSGGFDYAFKGFNSPMRISVESYYKKMSQVAPYDIDNVRIRYLGNNDAKAFAYGVEARLFGELVKDAESWVSIGWMKTMENLDNDFYQQYFNAQGELITDGTTNQVVADSQRVDIGWLRRPTDRRLSFGMYFSDYLTTNKHFKVFLQTLYGTNLPFNIPGSVRYRNALEIPAYLRVDLGFSYQLLPTDPNQRRSHSPFRNLENIWLNLEVFNLLDKGNVISYSLIKDFENNQFAVPNRLTPRLINIKLMVRW